MFDPIKLITSVAPAIGKAATGNLMGAVADGLKVFGIAGGGPKDLANAIQNATPEKLAELKKADNEFQTKMKSLDVDLERLAVDDRDSARDMQKALNSRVPAILAGVIVVGFFFVLGGLFIYPDMQNRALDIMLGSLGTMVAAVVGFYFGSSKSSSDKNLLMNQKK